MSNTSDNREIKVGYKVLYKRGSQLKSSSAPPISAVDYGNFWTSPRDGNGPLCIFSSEQHAYNFMRDLGLYENRRYYIRRCWYVKSNEKMFWDKEDSLCTYWLRIKNPDLIPSGTIFADAVHLIDEVSTGGQ